MNYRSIALFLISLLLLADFGLASAVDATAPSASPAPALAAPAPGMNRYMIVRTFPKGAIDGLDAAAVQSINATNAKYSVQWIHSYANADKTTTFCIYEGPNEKSIRDAAAANKIPVDYVVEIPVVLGSR
jgi:hypothetical protein